MYSRDPHRGGRPRHARPPYQQLLELYETKSLAEIARLYGIGKTSAHRWMQEARQQAAAAASQEVQDD